MFIQIKETMCRDSRVINRRKPLAADHVNSISILILVNALLTWGMLEMATSDRCFAVNTIVHVHVMDENR